MPFCPNCRYEYNPGTSTCPDCDEVLVDVLPPKSDGNFEDNDSKYGDWVKVARLTSQAYAAMINDGLKAKDIPVVILSAAGHFGQTGSMGTSSFFPVGGGYLVLVPEQYIDEANNEAESILGEEWLNARIDDLESEN